MMPLKYMYQAFENIIENRTFASKEQMLYIP